MEVGDFVNWMGNLSLQVMDEIPIVLRESAHTIVAEMKQRVIHEGRNNTGGQFSPYSTKPMLVSPKSFQTTGAFAKFTGASRAAKGLKGKRGIKPSKQYEWRTIKVGGVTRRLMVLEGGYKKFRELHGHPTERKIFYWNGTMLNSIRVTEPRTQGDIVVLTYEPNVAREALKIEGNSAREGVNIIAPSISEVRIIIKQLEERVTKLMQP